MAGGRLTGLYSGIRGLDLGPTKMRNDEAFRRQQLREDMRRALSGEKIAASELALREDALKQQGDTEMKRQALERELQTQRIGANQQEGAAQRGFAGQQGQLERDLRTQLQGSEVTARERAQERQIAASAEENRLAQQGQWDMLGAKLKQDSDQFTKEFALREKSLTREEKFDTLREASMRLENKARELQNVLAQRQQMGMLSGEEVQEFQRAMQGYQVESARLDNEARRYAAGPGRKLQEAAGLADIGGTQARTEFQELQTKAGRQQMAGPAASEKVAPKQLANLSKDERGEAARYDRLVSDGKATDVQTAIQKAWGKINELAAADDKDAKDRIEKLRAFINKAKKNESKNFSPSAWWGAWGQAARLLPDSDLENEAEELGLHSGL